ncbi:MAG: hypothetical protein U0441_05200 [Polyangiaceae bacterium]
MWLAFVFAFLAAFGGTARAQQKPGQAQAPFTKIYVCVKPPNVQKEVIAWSYVSGNDKIIARPDYEKEYPGKTVYVYNPSAPPGNTKLLPIPYNTLPCDPVPDPPAAETPAAPKDPKTAPKAGGGGGGSTEGSGAGSGSGSGSGSGTGTKKKDDPDDPPPGTPPKLTHPPPPEWHPAPPKGGVTQSWPQTVLPIVETPHILPSVESGHGVLPMAGLGGKGSVLPSATQVAREQAEAKEAAAKKAAEAAKTPYEKFCEQMALAGGLANLQLGEDIHAKDGDKYGIPGGKNPDGIKSATAQAIAGAVGIAAVVITAGGADKKIFEALSKEGAPPMLIRGGEKAAEEAAEKMIQAEVAKSGADAAHHLAEAMAKNGAIGEYSVMAKFTQGLGSRWQAHHILEVSMAKVVNVTATDRLPAVILSEAQHKAMTAELRIATAGVRDAEDLWAAYCKAYAKHPTWLAAIRGYFGK